MTYRYYTVYTSSRSNTLYIIYDEHKRMTLPHYLVQIKTHIGVLYEYITRSVRAGERGCDGNVVGVGHKAEDEGIAVRL